MIKLHEIHVEEMRGIRKLTLRPGGKNFAIYGPNGSGKSGVVDAIDFGLTGHISRLSGAGRGDLSLKIHGPHVDSRDRPEVAFVRLTVEFPRLRKKATIERKVSRPRDPIIEPNEPDIRAAFQELSGHSDLTLSRREIIKYILSEGSTRSKDVQALLKLDEIGQLRATLKTTANNLAREASMARDTAQSAAEDLRRHLDLQRLEDEAILEELNLRRDTVGLERVAKLEEHAVHTASSTRSVRANAFSRESALRDLDALSEFVQSEQGERQARELVSHVDVLVGDRALLSAVRRLSLYADAIDLVTEDACPLCDTAWEQEALLSHVRGQLQRARTASEVKQAMMSSADALRVMVSRLKALVSNASKIAVAVTADESTDVLRSWEDALDSLLELLTSFDPVLASGDNLRACWQQRPPTAIDALAEVRKLVSARADDAADVKIRQFLTIAAERLLRHMSAREDLRAKKQASVSAQAALKAYNASVEEALGGLYSQVESRLAEHYAYINDDDERNFKAKLSPKDAALNLEVDFHRRGLFPPSAYHSEGHQDGMGLCLYLSLMQQMLEADFTFSVLDDVVMSVDSQHRREVCRLLGDKFHCTQFVITTHDQAWYRQMLSQGLVPRNGAVNIRAWSVESGPLVSESLEIWEQIDAAVQRGEISSAAAQLRRHLEYVAWELAEALRAQVTFQGDANYDLGSLLPPALARYDKYLQEALKAARAWQNALQVAVIEEMRTRFQTERQAANVEQWVINPAVHYNEWENFSAQDFHPVLNAYKRLLATMECEQCQGLPYVTPLRGPVEALRCNCMKLSLNLKVKDT